MHLHGVPLLFEDQSERVTFGHFRKFGTQHRYLAIHWLIDIAKRHPSRDHHPLCSINYIDPTIVESDRYRMHEKEATTENE